MKDAKINIGNYEAFLLDYMEGNLSEEDTLLLKAFALAHPGLNIDLEDNSLVTLEADASVFEEKDLLRKNDAVSDDLLIGYIENTLDAGQRAAVETAVDRDAALQRELGLYKRTIAVPDANVVFANKASLKRGLQIVWYRRPATLAAAAAIVLLVGLWFLLRNSAEPVKATPRMLSSNSENNSPAGRSIQQPAINSNGAQLAEQKQAAANQYQVAVKNDRRPVTSGDTPLKKETPGIDAPNPVATNTPAPQRTDDIVSPVSDSLPVKLASSAPAYTLMVAQGVDEDEAQPAAEAPARKSFWARASQALHNLHKLGVKQVNAVETADAKEEQIVLSLGNFSIQKNKYNQE